MRQHYDVNGDNCSEQPRWECEFGGTSALLRKYHLLIFLQVTNLMSISGHMKSGKSEVQSEPL
jgi:hypothetical protein